MKTLVALSGRFRHMGGLYNCIEWATSVVRRNHTRVVKIARLRKGDAYGRLIVEITSDGCRFLRAGRVIKASKLTGKGHVKK